MWPRYLLRALGGCDTPARRLRCSDLQHRRALSRILVVDSIPRNSIGKALRREMPGLLAFRLAPEAVAPTVTLEGTLLEVWRGILRRADIWVTDNVFQFGADSLRAELAAGLSAERTGHRLMPRLRRISSVWCPIAFCMSSAA